jgi:voltage-gated potassium channel
VTVSLLDYDARKCYLTQSMPDNPIRSWSARLLPLRRRPVLYVSAPVSPERMLLNRVLLVLFLFASVIAVLWFDRAGLVDHYDGHVSFADVVYFAMITVTTVGYGDIVPIEPHTRVIDALFITPVRIFIWFVFLGTAYQLVIQKVLEDYRMAQLRDRLRDHVIVIGFGETGRVAAREVVSKGNKPEDIVVIDISANCVHDAANLGYVGLHGDPTSEDILIDAGIKTARAVLVCIGRDDTSVLSVLTVRNLNPRTRIVAIVMEDENVKLMRSAGANVTVMPSQAGGYLLAEAVGNNYLTDYVLDLLTTDGRVALVERVASPEEVGKSMRDLECGLVVRLYRGGEPIGFWETERNIIERDDLLLLIEPSA